MVSCNSQRRSPNIHLHLPCIRAVVQIQLQTTLCTLERNNVNLLRWLHLKDEGDTALSPVIILSCWGVSLWVSSCFLMQSGPHIHKKKTSHLVHYNPVIPALVFVSVCMCVRERAVCCVFSSAAFGFFWRGLTCVSLCWTTITSPLLWQQAFSMWMQICKSPGWVCRR